MYFFSLSTSEVAKQLTPPPVTIRSKPREIKVAPVAPAAPKKVSKASPKKVTKVAAPKPVPKLVPILKPDAPEMDLTTDKTSEDEVDIGVSASDDGGGEAVGDGSSAPADLTREGALIADSIKKPEYTKEALKARVQGLFAVDIHLDTDGNALEVELVQAPGFGMDERIVEALKTAKYLSKRDAAGKGLETWITIQFKLEIP